MNRCLDCIQIWYGCSLDISYGLNNFWDEFVKNKMAATAIKKIDMVVVGVILSEFPLFFTDMTYVPGQFIPYIFLAPSNKQPFSKMAVWKACGHDNL